MAKIRVDLGPLSRDERNAIAGIAGIRPFIPQRWVDCPSGYVPGQYVWPRFVEIDEAWAFILK